MDLIRVQENWIEIHQINKTVGKNCIVWDSEESQAANVGLHPTSEVKGHEKRFYINIS